MTTQQIPTRLSAAEYLGVAEAAFRLEARRPRLAGEPPEDHPVFVPDDRARATLRALEETGASPEYRYAFIQTGLLLTEDNQTLLSARDLEQWDRAIERFHRLNAAPF